MDVDEEANGAGGNPDGKEDDMDAAKAKLASAKKALEGIEVAIQQLEGILASAPDNPGMQTAIEGYKHQQVAAAAAVEQAGAELDKLRQSRGGLGHWEHKKNKALRKLNQAKKKKAAAETALAAAQENLEKCKEEVLQHQAAFDEAQATYIEKAKAVGAPPPAGGEQAAGSVAAGTPTPPITYKEVHRLLVGGDDFGLSSCPEILAQVRGLLGTAVARMAAAPAAAPQGPPVGTGADRADEPEEEEQREGSPLPDDDGQGDQQDEEEERTKGDRERSRSPRGAGGK
jgi:hypothetical protein